MEEYQLPKGIDLRGLTMKSERLKVGDIFVELKTGTFFEGDHAEIIRWVSLVLKGVGSLKTHSLRRARISIFLTKYQKRLNLPAETLGEYQVNSGYAYKFESIVIYREEDWKKVFIHESIHFFGFDLAADGFVGDQFPIPTPVDLKEVFCETNARILYCRWAKRNLQEEVRFSLLQMVKVLNHFGLTYADVVHRRHLDKFKETSNVFAYYVVTAMMMSDVKKFWRFSTALLKGGNVDFPNFIRAAAAKLHGSASLKRAEEAFRQSSTPTLKMIGGNCLSQNKWRGKFTATGSSCTRRTWKR